MARVTVEDCLKNVKNRFELVVVAAKRARQLMRGKEAKVEWDNDKATVVALREIAAGYTQVDDSVDPHDNDSYQKPVLQTTIQEEESEEIDFDDKVPAPAAEPSHRTGSDEE